MQPRKRPCRTCGRVTCTCLIHSDDIKCSLGFSAMTEFSVNILQLREHRHGPKGTTWVSSSDAMTLFHIISVHREQVHGEPRR